MNNNRKPISIPLDERLCRHFGVFFVKLNTLDELISFWKENRNKYSFLCQGIEYKTDAGYSFLNPYEFVFGETKASVASAVLRFGFSNVKVAYDDVESKYPGEIERQRKEIISDVENMIANCRYDDAISLSEKINPHGGWWYMTGFPESWGCDLYFDYQPAVTDPSIPRDEVEKTMLEQFFNEFSWEYDLSEISFSSSEEMDEEIEYWISEKNNGRDYFGSENE